MTPLERVADAYNRLGFGRGIDPGRRQQGVRCPAHPDRSPSMSVGVGPDERVLLHCHAGCDPASVLDALGLTDTDLFPPREHDQRPRERDEAWMWCVKDKGHRVVATYDYTAPGGRLLAQKLRCDHKDFGWRHPDPTRRSGWSYNRRGVDVRLYRPDVVRWAIRAERVLFLCEGEKDADTLHARKIPATTSPDGAGKWKPEYTELLRGAHLVIVADRDASGKAHAELVANAVVDAVASLEICVTAEGKDVTDHFAAGRTLADLVTVATPGKYELTPPPEKCGVVVDLATGEIITPHPGAA